MNSNREDHMVCLEVYKPSATLKFVLTDDEILACTPQQTFVLKYDHRNYIHQLGRLRTLIENDDMRDVVSLMDFCKFHPGGYPNQMAGLELVPTRLERHL